jgi:hypothetical protein
LSFLTIFIHNISDDVKFDFCTSGLILHNELIFLVISVGEEDSTQSNNEFGNRSLVFDLLTNVVEQTIQELGQDVLDLVLGDSLKTWKCLDVLFLKILVNEDGEKVFVVLTHISEAGSGKEEIKLFLCFLVGFYDSSSDRLLNGRFESKSTFFVIAGFFGFVSSFVGVELFFDDLLLNFLFCSLIELFLEFFLKWASLGFF